jgi:ATP-dependent DNA helicase RecG
VINLDDRLVDVLGDRTAKALHKAFGMEVVEDLVRHYPRRYATRGELTNLSTLRIDEHVTVLAEVRSVRELPLKNRRGTRLEVVVTDGTGTLDLTFFAQAGWHKRRLLVGTQGLFAGKVGIFNRRRQLVHPEYVLIAAPGEEPDPEAASTFANAVIPVYPAAQAVPSWRVAKALDLILDQLAPVPDVLPESVVEDMGFVSLDQALRDIHRPSTVEVARAARDRLRFDEAFVLQVALAQRRQVLNESIAVPRKATPDGLVAALDARLPYELTGAQRRVGEELARDMAQTKPMHRLLQGDVGSGKTLVALRAMLAVVDSGGQAALLAPTEVLARQHERGLRALLGPMAERGLLGGNDAGTRIELFVRAMPAAEKRRVLSEIASGETGIVVGTHALLSEGVQFADLGLVVVDEQHRFGVEQRAALQAKAIDGTRPHTLVMTATPIPRTVAMTVFGDLDTAVLDEKPPGRSPIVTHVVASLEHPAHLARAWQRVREEVESGHQVYVVCPRIGDDGPASEDEALPEPVEGDEVPRRPPLAVLDVQEQLSNGPLSGLRVGILHGRMPTDEKESVMARFTKGPGDPQGLDVIVATTVIEVGVDVPNATMMVVLDADRFGISQLHQLRGRVGRGAAESLCLLVSEAEATSPARERLAAVASTDDGFELARFDVEQRREGDILGAAQKGRGSLRLLEVMRDEDVVVEARSVAIRVVEADPQLADNPALAAAVAAITSDDRGEFLERG